MHAERQSADLTVEELFERAHELDGKRVSVVGHYVFGTEESALYHSGASAQDELEGIFWRRSCVNPGWRRVSRLNNRYVRVVGVFHYRLRADRRIERRSGGREFESVIPGGYGHAGLYPAEISSVTVSRPLR